MKQLQQRKRILFICECKKPLEMFCFLRLAFTFRYIFPFDYLLRLRVIAYAAVPVAMIAIADVAVCSIPVCTSSGVAWDSAGDDGAVASAASESMRSIISLK